MGLFLFWWGKDLAKPCAVGKCVGGFAKSLQKRWGLDKSKWIWAKTRYMVRARWVCGGVGLSCFLGNAWLCAVVFAQKQVIALALGG